MPPTRRLPATTLLHRDAGRNAARLFALAGRDPAYSPAGPAGPAAAPTRADAPVQATVMAPGARPVGGVVVGWQGGATPGGVPGSAGPFTAPAAVAVYGDEEPPAPPPPGVPMPDAATPPEGAPERRWWGGEDAPGSLDLPPPPFLWEWWCEVFRRSGYCAAAVSAVRAGPPDGALGDGLPRPGTARIHRAWSGGWAGVYPPISEVIRGEREAAHREEVEAAARRREAAIQQALDDDLRRQVQLRESHLAATMREGQILDALRGANLIGAANAVRINDKLRALVERSMDSWSADGATLPLMDAVKLAKEMGSAGRALAGMAASLVETSRLAAGDPTVIVGASGKGSGAGASDRASAIEAVRHIAQLTGAAGVLPEGLVVVGEDAASEYETAVAVDARRYRVAVDATGVDAGAPSPGAGPSGPDAAPTPVPGPPGVPGALSGPVVAVPGVTARPPGRPAPPPLASAFTVPAEAVPGGAYGGGAYGGGPGGGAFG